MKHPLYSLGSIITVTTIAAIAILPAKAPCAVSNAPLQKYEWKQAIFAGSKLVQIGNHKLVTPIVFPAELSPLERKALVSYSHVKYPKRFYFTLFYSISRENRLIKWVREFPKSAKLDTNSIQITSKPNYYQSHRTWSYTIDAKTSTSYLHLRAASWKEPFAEYKAYTVNDPNTQEYLTAMTADGSPLVNQHGFLALTIIFDPLQQK